MKKIDIINNSSYQSMTLVLDNGDNVSFTLYYSDNQQGWFFSLIYNTFELDNRRLVMSANLLRQFRNFIPFGLMVVTSDRYEPIFLNDFLSGRASLYVLNSDDILTAEQAMSF